MRLGLSERSILCVTTTRKRKGKKDLNVADPEEKVSTSQNNDPDRRRLKDLHDFEFCFRDDQKSL